MMSAATIRPAAVILALITSLSACSRDPQVAAREYLASGDAYVARGQLKEAIIEYRNAVNAMPSLEAAHYKLARA
jgi:Tfp pilus assembly protein PilF